MDTKTERRDVPEWVEKHITSKGGLNAFGKPNFRVIWGGNRTHLVGGMFKNVTYFDDAEGRKRAIVTEIAEMRTLLKYHPERWHLERWRGAEYYGDPDEWYQNSWDPEARLHTMGDYPNEGDYEHVFFLAQCSHMAKGDKDWCMPCQVGMGQYIPLEPNVQVLDMQIYALLKSEDVSQVAEMGALFMRENLKRQIRNKIVGDRVRGAMRPRIALQPTSWQSGMGSKCSVPEAKMLTKTGRPSLGFNQVDGMRTQSEEEN